jgi:Response regulator
MPLEPTVFIVDDDEDVRNAIKWLIESVGLKVETFASAEQFLNAYNENCYGCVVLDVRMPGMGGLGLLEHLTSRGLHPPIIMLTAHGDVPIAVRALRAGALNFIEKPFTDQQLLDCIQEALEKEVDIFKQTIEHSAVASRLALLTPRENEVLARVISGQANKVIAAELGISDKTVEVHRKHIMEKMQARSLAELVRMTLLHREDRDMPGLGTGSS